MQELQLRLFHGLEMGLPPGDPAGRSSQGQLHAAGPSRSVFFTHAGRTLCDPIQRRSRRVNARPQPVSHASGGPDWPRSTLRCKLTRSTSWRFT